MALAAAVEGRAANLSRQSLRAEPRGVKLIDQVDRRDEEAMAAGLNDPARPSVDQIGHGAHPYQIALPLEDVHQPRAIKRRQDRILLRLQQVESPLVDRQFDRTTRSKFLNRLFDFAIETLVSERARHQIAQVALRLAMAVVVMNRQVINIPARQPQYRAVPLHVIVADGYEFDRRVDLAHRR